MGLLPEFFMLLGIDIFLAMSLLSALLDKELPSTLQYLFQGAAIIGLGQLFINQGYVNTGVFGQTPTDPTRFWISIVYLSASLANVTGLNLYLGFVRRRITLATTFSGTVTVPTVMTSLFFVTSFVGSGGDVSFGLGAITILGVSLALSGLSIFGFLRQAAKRLANTSATRESNPSPQPASVSQPATTSENGETPPEISLDTELPFNLRPGPRDEWEEAPSKDEVGGDT